MKHLMPHNKNKAHHPNAHQRNAKYPGYAPTAEELQELRDFNDGLRYLQSFRFVIPSGASTQSVTLNSPGLELLGISMLPVTGSDITDMQVGLSINNNNLLVDVDGSAINPATVQGLIYMPTPQPLQGNDILKLNFNNNLAQATAYVTFFYIPRV